MKKQLFTLVELIAAMAVLAAENRQVILMKCK